MMGLEEGATKLFMMHEIARAWRMENEKKAELYRQEQEKKNQDDMIAKKLADTVERWLEVREISLWLDMTASGFECLCHMF